ncbi:MAG TPA: saccharopine dehydrogenase, partial [Thermoanaerobaculia bacterium]|nr:saccharopine dehydrogenase [Thermoanaerobaculia bacterium]
MTPDGGRDLDLVLWGATGYTGRLVARYLAERLAAGDEPVAWALGGRDRAKLEAVRRELAE